MCQFHPFLEHLSAYQAAGVVLGTGKKQEPWGRGGMAKDREKACSF